MTTTPEILPKDEHNAKLIALSTTSVRPVPSGLIVSIPSTELNRIVKPSGDQSGDQSIVPAVS